MSAIVDELLKRELEEVFAQSDPAKRSVAIATLFSTDCVFSDAHGTHIGHEELAKAAAELHGMFPGFQFTSGLRQSLEEAGRQQWYFGPPGQPPQVSGLDVVLVRDGKITALYTFLDPKA